MEIREVRPDEWRSLKRLRLRALEEDPDAFGSTFAEESARPDAAWRSRAREGWGHGPQLTLAAVDGDRWFGMAVCVIPEAEARSANVYAMWVDPAARRQGVGRSLLQALTEWAASKGAAELLLTVAETNTAAVTLYERAGFASTGESHALRPDSPVRCLWMRRHL